MKIQVKILNRMGLHARPAALLAQCAGKFSASIEIILADGTAVDAKSILSLLMLGAPQGTELTVHAAGDDAESALAAVAELFESKFDED